ncbi:hypothetical protein CH253_08190 [Rhodococcus sp. 06-156-3C]|uniref:hypothetical protein n=1 Tax=Rhodococcus sp. 06-156-3C TaxID=2022486 RepID=UPI000B9A774E|nr:hypothetical protein [Rhodococcus sp. 06-156-3C]OZD23832.1 hypothetical protein CH253_08190 [Rhodococcus sp. 06-156-3C]
MKLRARVISAVAVACLAGAGCATTPAFTEGTVKAKHFKPDTTIVSMMPAGNGVMMPIVIADPPRWSIVLEQCKPECREETITVDAATWDTLSTGDYYRKGGRQ